MRIGLFTDTYHPAVNGIAFVVDILRKGLEDLGHEVYIFAPKPSVLYKEKDKNIIRYTAIKGITWDEEMTSVFFPPVEIRRIKSLNLDVAHFFTPDQVGLLGAYAAIKNKVPLVGQHSTDIYEYSRYYGGTIKGLIDFPIGAPLLLKDLTRKWKKIVPLLGREDSSEMWRQRFLVQFLNALYEKCETVIVPSSKMHKQLLSWEPEYDITLLPTGVDPIPFKKSDVTHVRKQLDLTDDDRVVLYVGRLGQEKNIELLIEAFASINAKVPKSKLIITGESKYRPTLEELAERLLEPGTYKFTGKIRRQKLGAYYGMADVFVFPSVTDTQGLVLHEAAGAGLPLVIVDKEVSEMVRDGKNGYICKPAAEDVSKSVSKILNNPKLRAAMSQASKKLAREYSEASQAKKQEEIYQKIISNYRA